MKMIKNEAEINGINIHYRSYGQGEPLLLIMGLGGNADWWGDEFLSPLGERFQVVAFDNRGAGRSGKPEGPYSIQQMASDAVGLMDHLGWDTANVLGLSMGGMITLELALDYPGRVRKIMLVCTTYGGREQVLAEPEIYATLNMPREGLTEEDIARRTLHLLFPPEFIEENSDLMDRVVEDVCIAPISASCFKSQLGAITSWSAYPRLADLNRPALVITGEKDALIPPQNSHILNESLPDSRLIEIPGAGHGIAAMYPKRIAQEVIGFLS